MSSSVGRESVSPGTARCACSLRVDELFSCKACFACRLSVGRESVSPGTARCTCSLRIHKLFARKACFAGGQTGRIGILAAWTRCAAADSIRLIRLATCVRDCPLVPGRADHSGGEWVITNSEGTCFVRKVIAIDGGGVHAGLRCDGGKEGERGGGGEQSEG